MADRCSVSLAFVPTTDAVLVGEVVEVVTVLFGVLGTEPLVADDGSDLNGCKSMPG